MNVWTQWKAAAISLMVSIKASWAASDYDDPGSTITPVIIDPQTETFGAGRPVQEPWGFD